VSTTSANSSNGASKSSDGDGEPSIGELAREASTHFSTLVRSEIELAKLEVTATAKRAGIGGVFFAVAAVILVFSLTFGFIALAEGLVVVGLWRWLAYLTVFGFFVILAAVCAVVGLMLVKRVGKPERTLTTVKDTAAWAKHPTHTG
jgi:hypothetical protein